MFRTWFGKVASCNVAHGRRDAGGAGFNSKTEPDHRRPGQGQGTVMMARDPKAEAALALHRFGLGPRAGSIAAIASDPRGALRAELDRPGAGHLTDPDLLTSGEAARAAFDFRRE